METINITPELQNDIDRFMTLIGKIKDNGELSLFSALFQIDYQMISYLHAHPESHPSDLADNLKVTRPTIAANLRILEEKGYLERRVDEDNRRQVYVSLTQRGEFYYQICQKQLGLLFMSWFSYLGKEDTENLFRILEKSSDPSLMTEELRRFTFGD